MHVPPQKQNLPVGESSLKKPSSHSNVRQLFPQAAAEEGSPIHEPLRSSLAGSFGHDFSRVRVHSGPASAAAAGTIGARAYTLGTDIHLGMASRGLTGSAFDRLIAHEAIHTVQQGSRAIAPHPGLTTSSPQDAAEQEAGRLAESVTAASTRMGSRSLALRDQMRSSMPAYQISRSVSPQIQRDLTGTYPTAGGDFNLNLKDESHPGANCGMSGTIKFKAKDTAPDSDSIRLLQVVRDEDLTTGKDYVWTGGEANRNKMMTTADPGTGVQGGSFVDHSAAAATPRTSKTDAPISPYYRDYWPNASSSQDGSKKGKSVSEASLWDYPGSHGNRRFSFETVAKATAGPNANHVYGTVMWGFTISDASKGTIDHEYATGRDVTLRTTDKAIDKFNEFYRNPGASTAPK